MRPSKLNLPPLPASLVDVALVDSATAAAVGQAGISFWLEEVRLKRAPQPVIRRPRFTRWALKDVKSYWAAQADASAEATATGKRVVANATRASAAAKVANATRQAR